MFIVATLVDQLSKVWALNALGQGQVVKLIGNYFTLELIHNPGAAFSLGTGKAWIFSLISLAVLGAIFYYLPKIVSSAWIITLGFFAAGALGNLIDRLFRAPGWGNGHVVDFLNYHGFFIGNIADIYIFIGAVAIIAFTLFGVEPVAKAQAATTNTAAPKTVATKEELDHE
ncbi:signal peptidase II [Boudabousia tangfeifanii]|uniref:Lipoprotein signal peptidase n=1 Tax=Boudabousia tangfeifanii TaxID=1912795 RepID=A0A1D9MMI0_9ACTO|nr:signal peptidase II [Boudabousia tangfeifanii]